MRTMRLCFLLLVCVIAVNAWPIEDLSLRVSGGNGWYVPQTDGSLRWVGRFEGERELAHYEAQEAIMGRLSTNTVNFYLYTLRNTNAGQQIKATRASIDASNFNPENPTRITIHGWNANYKDGVNTKIAAAWFQMGDYNMIAVDWVRGRSLEYASSVSAASGAGKKIAALIDFLVLEYGMSLDTLEVVGFSLGAHVAGHTAKQVKSGEVGKVVGLDPAMPLISYSNTAKRLSSDDAKYVESIHTAGGTMGFTKPIGKAAFYVNGGKSQPGCGLDITGSCAHTRAVTYYVESLLWNNFPTKRCDTYKEANKNACGDKYSSVLMGATVNIFVAEGIFYVPVNKESPFGLGEPLEESTTLAPARPTTVADDSTTAEDSTTADDSSTVTSEEDSTTAAPEEGGDDSSTAAPEDDSTTDGSGDSTTAAPEDDSTTSAPEEGGDDSTTAAPEDDSTTSPPEEDSTTDAPVKDSTTAVTEDEDSTTAAPEDDSTTEAPEDDSTTEAPEEDSTTAATEEDSTTEASEEDSTTASPEDDSTTEAPEEDSTTAVTEDGEEVSTTAVPEEDSTTDASEEDSTTAVTEDGEEDSTTDAQEEDSTTSAPEEDSTTSASEEDSTTDAPEEDSTTDAQEEDSTTSAPEEDSTTSAPEEDSTTDASEEDSTTSAPEEDSTTAFTEEDSTTAVTVDGEDDSTTEAPVTENPTTTTPEDINTPITDAPGERPSTDGPEDNDVSGKTKNIYIFNLFLINVKVNKN
ncbi:serine-rich adhesin for platelets-like isoform X2 [Drosophila subobscura]|uniref:serine-rich adhesin for platelets-like isoform X2 n=1 Tax=Drosophila subobscura TaxID=7241 RepID=UPI00155A476C|nr:serine-rich adhesin for platelets-like isoform X2 [Drosophila subobscura]